MMSLLRSTLLFSAILLCSAGLAQARTSTTPLQHDNPQDEWRCTALQEQFAKAAASRSVDNAAKDAAAQGAVLCRAGHYTEGVATMEKALQMIGETPAK